ncbi:hypothetical protein BD311DRAFT_764742 [Dichomitus squalens]|uniref:Uncharacterized protein n=1 Tax=Dichomitus squalens TaxID=114155 RepID=A0A4Q9MHL0_9APHY|nr:hypothetical protein BD311DRAFT_764742 [Dichomitus squalens]
MGMRKGNSLWYRNASITALRKPRREVTYVMTSRGQGPATETRDRTVLVSTAGYSFCISSARYLPGIDRIRVRSPHPSMATSTTFGQVALPLHDITSCLVQERPRRRVAALCR